MKPTKRKAPMTQNPARNKEISPPQASLPQQFSALAAKYALQNVTESDDNCFAGNKGDKSDTDIDTFDNDSDSGDSDVELYT